jgi:hypothetical protein
MVVGTRIGQVATYAPPSGAAFGNRAGGRVSEAGSRKSWGSRRNAGCGSASPVAGSTPPVSVASTARTRNPFG